MQINLKLDRELLAEQKQLLLEMIWDIEKQDNRFKLWGIVEMIDHIQEYWEEDQGAAGRGAHSQNKHITKN